jgi:Helix-turn-helix domain
MPHVFTATPAKGSRIVGAERHTLAITLVERYVRGESIRSLAASTNRSYGSVHRVLSESGVQFRARGGGAGVEEEADDVRPPHRRFERADRASD